jgi:beta-glucosidase
MNQLSARPTETFIWGVSTSSYQIEGATKADGRGASIWDTFCQQKGRIANGDTGDIACDHYHRFPEDIALMREMGVKAYRFSVAWPRLLPTGRGHFNEPGAAFYDRLIDGLLEAGIEPWLCLYHWDLPQALDDEGGWLSRDAAGWFADYATLVARRYGDRVKRFATFNEPGVFALFGFGFGWQPPGVIDADAHRKAIHHVNLAHGAAVDALRSGVSGASIGVIHNMQPCLPASAALEDLTAAARLHMHWNQAFPDPQILGYYPKTLAEELAPQIAPGDMARICRPLDWLGINHYSPIYARGDKDAPLGYAWAGPPAGMPQSEIGWQVQPDAFRDILLDASKRYRLPIFVTENGTGGRDQLDHAGGVKDQHRIDYLNAYISAMQTAIAAGADVRGYFVWSLLDNFEWGAGYGDRFGLVYVDYPTLRRIPKASARWYADRIARETATHPASRP